MTYDDYRGIDLEPYVNWLVICNSRECSGYQPTVLGRIRRGSIISSDVPFVFSCGGDVMPPADPSKPYILKTSKKPRTRLRTESAPVIDLEETGWLGGWDDDTATKATNLPLYARVRCPRCGRILPLHRLSLKDLRQPAERS
jgi:hypothetical protein